MDIDKNLPKFIVKKNLQKSLQTGIYFSDIVTPDILKDVCIKITGKAEFSYSYVDNDYQDDYLTPTYNKGRLAILYWNSNVYFITFSEKDVGGRNSSIQSVPTAYNMYFLSSKRPTAIYYYFINRTAKVQTNYHVYIYRLMKAIGFIFLNEPTELKSKLTSFSSISDLIRFRKENSSRNRSNNASYVEYKDNYQVEIYGKTYGANKYESSLMSYALSKLATKNEKIIVYQVSENDLSELPSSSINVLSKLGNITYTLTNKTLEKNQLETQTNFRSATYIYNLYDKLGKKSCAMCSCNIDAIIQGAHIWPVAYIKADNTLTIDEKWDMATDGNNGLWLCENHHKLFDRNLITICDTNGAIHYSDKLEIEEQNYLDTVTLKYISKSFITEKFSEYLKRRNMEYAKVAN